MRCFLVALPLALLPRLVFAGCPVGTEVVVDNDRGGSGYSEQPAANWLDRGVGACLGTYRYLSHTVGDGSRRGRAFWRPNITVSGVYEVETSFRATENRTSDADYILRGDRGAPQRRTFDQRGEGECRREIVGRVFCAAGGGCELELDGTDDNQSDAADATTFTLISCEETPPPPPPPGDGCAGIVANPAFELCREAENRCEGVFTDGAGCNIYCAAAGMRCVARYGGEPGCMEEPNTSIPCDADNGHQSDWCVCEGDAPTPPPPPEDLPDHLTRHADALYWCGAPVHLVGYGNYGMLTEQAFDYAAHFDRIAEAGLNFVRVWGQYHWTRDLSPFAGTTEQRDLERLDDAYFVRLRALVEAAARRGIIVQVTLFDSVQLEGSSTDGNRWRYSPYRDANNAQPFLQDPTGFNDTSGPIWTDVNQPYIHAVVDTLCDLPNVIYEVMNEPEGSGGDAGRGTPPFVDAVIGELDARLDRPECTGSTLISTNDDAGRTLADPRVDVIAVHGGPRRARALAERGRPVILSNDGDDSQVTAAHGFGDLDPAARAARIDRFVANSADSRGHLHLEVLDKDFHGASWLSADYEPRADRYDPAVLAALTAAVSTPPTTCSPPAPPPPDAGVVPPEDASTNDAGVGPEADAGPEVDAGTSADRGPQLEEEPKGCRCVEGRGGAAWGLLLAVAAWGGRRRRDYSPRSGSGRSGAGRSGSGRVGSGRSGCGGIVVGPSQRSAQRPTKVPPWPLVPRA